MTWALNLALKLCGGNKLIAYAIVAVLGAAIVATLCALAYLRGYQAADQKARVKELESANTTLQADLKTANSKLTALAGEKHESKQITDTLAADGVKERIVYRTLRSGVAAVSAMPVATVTDAKRTGCVVPGEYVGLWNAALEPERAGSVPVAASGIVDTAAGASAAEAEVGSDELLTNHIDNSEIDSANRRQCRTLIEWHQAHDR
jgi:hypothetical protein